MAIVFALEDLFEAVVDDFDQRAITCAHSFGWAARDDMLLEGPTIVWTPGDTSGSLGDEAAPRYPGEPIRQLFTLWERCTLTIYSYDASDPEDEQAQYNATRRLYDSIRASIGELAAGRHKALSATWIREAKTRQYGAAIEFVFALESPVFAPSEDYGIVSDAVADVTLTELDESAEFTAPERP